MSLLTIRCRLIASETSSQGTVFASELARQYIWEKMATTTHLVNELLKQVAVHPNFEVWQHRGRLPDKELKTLWESLKTEACYGELPARFLTSAKLTVSEIYDSWLI